MSLRIDGDYLPADLRNTLIDRVNERSVSLATSGVPVHPWNRRHSISDALDAAVDLGGHLRHGMTEWGSPNGDAEIIAAANPTYTIANALPFVISDVTTAGQIIVYNLNSHS